MAQPTKKAWETPRLLVLSLEETASGRVDNFAEGAFTGLIIGGQQITGNGFFYS